MFKVNNKNRRRSGAFNVNFFMLTLLFQKFLLLTLNKQVLSGHIFLQNIKQYFYLNSEQFHSQSIQKYLEHCQNISEATFFRIIFAKKRLTGFKYASTSSKWSFTSLTYLHFDFNQIHKSLMFLFQILNLYLSAVNHT